MIFKSDKLDYLRGPRKEFFFDNFFSIGQGPSNAWKLNWNLLVFFSFIFILAQCDILSGWVVGATKYLPIQFLEDQRYRKSNNCRSKMTYLLFLPTQILNYNTAEGHDFCGSGFLPD